jgi:hypothetical protein
MDLQTFVSETLIQIISGIQEAGRQVDSETVKICPRLDGTAAHKGYSEIVPSRKDAPATVISFDVALQATEGSSTKGGLGVVMGVVSLGSAGQSSSESSSLSRVQFSIPVIRNRRAE